MADKRMFSKDVVMSDDFLDMSPGARALYLALGMVADDDGFINNVKSTVRQVGLTNSDFDELVSNGYMLKFESGVACITHWLLNNSIRKDRYHQSNNVEEKAKITKDETNKYILDNQMTTTCQPSVNQMTTEDRIEKISIDKYREEKDREEENIWSVRLSVSQISDLSQIYGEDVVKAYIKKMEQYQRDNKKRYKAPYETLKAWLSEDSKPKKKKPTAGNERSYSNEDMEELERKLLAN